MGASVIVEGAQQQFAAFLDRSGQRLFRLAVLLAGDVPDGEDLLQSVLERSFARWAAGEPPDAPESYVRAALVHASARHWKRHRQGRELLVADPPDLVASDSSSDVDLRGRLLAALRTLPAQQRAVIALRYFDDHSEADVAALLGLRVGTVKAHANRGLKRLRQHPDLLPYLQPAMES